MSTTTRVINTGCTEENHTDDASRCTYKIMVRKWNDKDEYDCRIVQCPLEKVKDGDRCFLHFDKESLPRYQGEKGIPTTDWHNKLLNNDPSLQWVTSSCYNDLHKLNKIYKDDVEAHQRQHEKDFHEHKHQQEKDLNNYKHLLKESYQKEYNTATAKLQEKAKNWATNEVENRLQRIEQNNQIARHTIDLNRHESVALMGDIRGSIELLCAVLNACPFVTVHQTAMDAVACGKHRPPNQSQDIQKQVVDNVNWNDGSTGVIIFMGNLINTEIHENISQSSACLTDDSEEIVYQTLRKLQKQSKQHGGRVVALIGENEMSGVMNDYHSKGKCLTVAKPKFCAKQPTGGGKIDGRYTYERSLWVRNFVRSLQLLAVVKILHKDGSKSLVSVSAVQTPFLKAIKASTTDIDAALSTINKEYDEYVAGGYHLRVHSPLSESEKDWYKSDKLYKTPDKPVSIFVHSVSNNTAQLGQNRFFCTDVNISNKVVYWNDNGAQDVQSGDKLNKSVYYVPSLSFYDTLRFVPRTISQNTDEKRTVFFAIVNNDETISTVTVNTIVESQPFF